MLPMSADLVGVADYMFQCKQVCLQLDFPKADISSDFLKVVGTTFHYLNGEEIPSHQYSVTQYERDLRKGNAPSKDEHGRELMV